MVLARVAHYLQTRIPVRLRCGPACDCHASLCALGNTPASTPVALAQLAWRSRLLRRVCLVPVAQEIAEVVIEDEKQLDDSAENF
jgi:hypothetical protein